MKLRNILHSDIITKILTTMKNTRERNRGMDRPNWGKDPFTKFRKQRGNPQIGQPPGLIPKKGYPIFGLALLALHTPTVKTGRPAKQYIRREGLALFLRTGTEASVCDTVRARPCAGDYTLIMGDGHREPFRSWAAERAEATCFDMSRFDAIPPTLRGKIIRLYAKYE